MDLTIVFDLDDTLYLERDYVRSGFAALDHWVADNLGVSGFGAAAQTAWDEGERYRSFDAALASLGIAADADLVAALLAEYRGHVPDITLLPDANAFLAACMGVCRLALITDGPAIVQQRKIDALGLDRLGFDPIIATGFWGEAFWKPHLRAFRAVEDHHGTGGRRFVYVADNPAKDFIAPHAIGWGTVQINRTGAVHPRVPLQPEHAAQMEIQSLVDLTPQMLDRLLTQSSPARR